MCCYSAVKWYEVSMTQMIEANPGAFPASVRKAPIRTKPVAQGLLSPTVGDRVLSVGEAAGQTKTTTGGGISYGAPSGYHDDCVISLALAAWGTRGTRVSQSDFITTIGF